MTKIIFFIHQNSGKSGRMFLKIIQKRINDTRFEICPSIEHLENNVNSYKPYLDRKIVVLFTDTEDRLNQLYMKKEIFRDKKIVMVLPGKNQQNISKAHKFFPRYFTFIDNKYDDLCEVLNKMIVQ